MRELEVKLAIAACRMEAAQQYFDGLSKTMCETYGSDWQTNPQHPTEKEHPNFNMLLGELEAAELQRALSSE